MIFSCFILLAFVAWLVCSKRLFKEVASGYGLEVAKEQENLIRFPAADWFIEKYNING